MQGLPNKLRKSAVEADSPLGARTPKIPAGVSSPHGPPRAIRPTLSLTRTHIPRTAGHGHAAAPPFPEHALPGGGPGGTPTRGAVAVAAAAAAAVGRAYTQTPAALNAAAAALTSRTFFPRTSSLTYSVEDDGGGGRDDGRGRAAAAGGDRRGRETSASEFSDVFSMSNPDSFTMGSGFAMYDNTLYRDVI